MLAFVSSIAFSRFRRSGPRALLPLLLACGAAPVGGAAQATTLPLLPQPRAVAEKGTGFRIGEDVRLDIPRGEADAEHAAAWLRQQLGQQSGQQWGLPGRAQSGASAGGTSAGSRAIRFVRVTGLPKEGYRLSTSQTGATISAGDAGGFFYGAVTLWQLATGGANMVPAVEIEDAPRFAWRGFMLDSARHFQSPQFIKALIDGMAAHKLNILHWHLVDDQGWRIEIPKYPKLTSVGAWRSPATAPGAPPLPKVGGFYTQAEIREIVAYAAARNITIVPEIEMPGHALSAIRAYPELGPGTPVPPGITADWGVYTYLYNVEDSTFRFLEDVLADVMKLFPSPYIHIGGDEAVMTQWKQSPAAQAKMRSLGITDERKLQSWFITRMEKFLNANGRKLIGWDEILEGGIAPNATVMSWRGIDGAIVAAKAGHDTVLAPSPMLYLDHLQGATSAEGPGRNKVITLEDYYRFDPLPDTLTEDQQRHVLGLQAPLFTEHVRGDARAAYMTFPRLSALAEVAWRGEGDDFEGFVDRLLPQIQRLEKIGIKPALSAFTPMAAVSDVTLNGAKIALSTQVEADIRYTLDGSEPGPNSPAYTAPIGLELQAPIRLRAAAYRGAVRLPGTFERTFDAAAVRRRDDRELKQCTSTLVLALEDDAPAEGPRANFLSDVLNPCWIYESAPMDGIARIDVDVGQVPFNFQLNNGREIAGRGTPRTPSGELEIRIDGCEGERIASITLDQVKSPTITRLSAPIAPRTGAHDLCLTFTGRGTNPHWTIASVQLTAK
ncbi:family 20 glycosylhydrolase [Allosphingosinicella deserti]|uniref:beta-N-acetylhexosaminidase n=1 Tax=Allosphingosinicella deserti TaxID=2116704 RepID=A0A2P7QM16_9SPHN|nr:family 20 glycosylhydrolase [Sphingomonas deserti]PSJ38999.1 beta-hexosaminidase [Sphingomonas deserti]